MLEAINFMGLGPGISIRLGGTGRRPPHDDASYQQSIVERWDSGRRGQCRDATSVRAAGNRHVSVVGPRQARTWFAREMVSAIAPMNENIGRERV